MRIKIVQVLPPVQMEKYSYFELIYAKDGKTEKPKKIMSFSPEYNTLSKAEPGAEYDVELKKDDNGYWKWVTCKLADGSIPASSPMSGGFVNNRNNPDVEKAIIRQSSLAQAVASGINRDDVEGILRVAEAFEDWVNRE